MTRKQHFFSNMTQPPLSETKHGAFIDVGGAGDCGFRAIAAGLIELYSTHSLIQGRDALLQSLLTRYVSLFPTHTHQSTIVTPTQRLQQLKKRVPWHQLIGEIAFTLRQIAVDELCAHPERYPGAFVGEHEGTSPSVMRKMETWIDESSLAALSNALHLPVTVQVVDGSKSLAHQFQYNTDENHRGVLIRLEKSHYTPYLRENASQGSPNQTPSIVAATDEQAFNRSLPEILMIIAQDQQRMKEKFESIFETLEAQMRLSSEQGGLNKQDLLDIYVKGMRTSDYLQGRVHYAGMESGTQHFFDAIKKHEPTSRYSNTSSQHDAYVVHELIHAIARAISIGHISPDAIYKDNRNHSAPR